MLPLSQRQAVTGIPVLAPAVCRPRSGSVGVGVALLGAWPQHWRPRHTVLLDAAASVSCVCLLPPSVYVLPLIYCSYNLSFFLFFCFLNFLGLFWDTGSYDLGNAFGHMALGCEDIYAACEKIKALGGNVTREPGPMKGGETHIAFIKDPDGYPIELIQTKQ